MTDWIVTIPKTIPWSEYQKEIDMVSKNSDMVMNYRVAYRPKCKAGDRMFICHDGLVRGWMEIYGLRSSPFMCETTGRDWPPGWYVYRGGPWHPVDGPEMKGFRGLRRYE